MYTVNPLAQVETKLFMMLTTHMLGHLQPAASTI